MEDDERTQAMVGPTAGIARRGRRRGWRDPYLRSRLADAGGRPWEVKMSGKANDADIVRNALRLPS